MSLPQSSSTCCRAINRRLLGQHDSVWIPESALSAAYERYCSISRIAFRRHGSSVPGPLESRRRQNKRHMGELSFGDAHGSAPLWDLENLPDLTQWQWQPPTQRRSRQAVQAERNLWKTILEWISPLKDARTSGSCQNVHEHPTSSSSDALPDAIPITMVDPTSVTLHTPTLGSGTDSASLVEQSFNALVQDAFLDRTLKTCPNFSSFCDMLRDGLSEGRISVEALHSLVPSMSDGLVRSAFALGAQQETNVFERRKAQLIWASIDGLEALHARLGDLPFDGNVWLMLLQEASQLRFNHLRTFARLMSPIPSDAIGPLSIAIRANLGNSLNALSQAAHKTTHEKQVNKLASIIQRLASVEHRHILEKITLDVAQSTQSSNYTKVRFCWLQILARLRNLDDGALANACALLELGTTAEPMTPRQITRIFLGRLNSCYSVKDIMKVYTSLIGIPDSRCLAKISSVFWQTNQPRYIKKLCKFLFRMGRQQDIRHLMRGLTKIIKNETTPLANLTIGLGYPELALKIYLRYGRSRFAAKNFWRSSFSLEILKMMMESKSLEHARILKALRVFLKPRRVSYPKKKKGGLGIKQIRKVEAAALAFASARHIPDRTSFRLVQMCVSYIRSNGASVSSKALQALWQVVTKDLVNNRPGRAARLRWFFKVMFEERGLEETRAAYSELVQWRSRVLSKLGSSNRGQ